MNNYHSEAIKRLEELKNCVYLDSDVTEIDNVIDLIKAGSQLDNGNHN